MVNVDNFYFNETCMESSVATYCIIIDIMRGNSLIYKAGLGSDNMKINSSYIECLKDIYQN